MKLCVVITLYIWLILSPTWAQTKFTFDLDAYANSVDRLRDEVTLKAKNKAVTCHGLPMLSGENKYLLVEIQAVEIEAAKRITVTIHLRTLYIEGYSDQYENKCRSFVTDDASSGASSSLCSGVKAQKLGFQGNYASLLGNAGKGLTRETFELGISLLKDRMTYIAGKARPDKKAQAQFLLSVVQMFSEAVRFTYIQDQVKGNPKFYPNYRMTSLENEWGKISTAIERAQKDGTFDSKYQVTDLKNEDGTKRVVTKVSDIKGDVGLLNKIDVKTCKATVFMSSMDDHLDHFELR